MARESGQNAELSLLWAGTVSHLYLTLNKGTVLDPSEMTVPVSDPLLASSGRDKQLLFLRHAHSLLLAPSWESLLFIVYLFLAWIH